ncbi:hypothetical protein BMETH_1077_1 [methanotrophic bacterial endosymbiont of Bathymodiolus sp.]|nr:hypothetical protein BMETH_1077_1 [methanotrophic bacterial endosymbiont of Bathymodiolus sp.]
MHVSQKRYLMCRVRHWKSVVPGILIITIALPRPRLLQKSG